MNRIELQYRTPLIFLLAGLFVLALLYFRWGLFSAYLTNYSFLGALVMLEIVIACLFRYEEVFFPVTMASFLAATTVLPFGLGFVAFAVRWVFLGVGAVAGFVIWMRTNRLSHFGLFHLAAFFSVLAALVSASASATISVGVLKAGSLLLLFLYGSTGGRVALWNREKAFVESLVAVSEVLAFVAAACYLVGFQVFGNPNSMGAIIGVLVTPILLWAVATAETRWQRQRRSLALGLCGLLLAISVCRAAIVTDVIVIAGFALAVRRPRILIRFIFAAALLLEVMGVVSPARTGELFETLSGKFIFKTEEGQTHTGIFGSRRSPWEDSIAAIKTHPWFGTGFGTSDVGDTQGNSQSSTYTVDGTNREHGSSYLAMAEYMGLLGILPFVFLLALLLWAVKKVWVWVRSTGDVGNYAVPFALVTIAGLIHASFEDWLFAPGAYLCVFFWVSAFLLIDLAPEPLRKLYRTPARFPGHSRAQIARSVISA